MGIGGPLATAIDSVWENIRVRHPEIPDVVVTMASGSMGRGRAPRLGQFGPDRWERAGGLRLPELFVGAEGLADGGREVLGTLLHEAAHGLASSREIAEASDNGRYHNKKYKALAEEVGLALERHQRFGWSLTALPDETAARYTDQIGTLTRAIVAHRRPIDQADPESGGEDDRGGGDAESEQGRKSRSRNGQPLACSCAPPRRIRAHKTIIEGGPILCGVCRNPFALTDDPD